MPGPWKIIAERPACGRRTPFGRQPAPWEQRKGAPCTVAQAMVWAAQGRVETRIEPMGMTTSVLLVRRTEITARSADTLSRRHAEPGGDPGTSQAAA